jgi:hypothetical protein
VLAPSTLHTISQPDEMMEWDEIPIPRTSTAQIVEHLRARGTPKDDDKEEDKTKDTPVVDLHRLAFTSPTATAEATITGPIALDNNNIHDDQTLNSVDTMENPDMEILKGADAFLHFPLPTTTVPD